MKTTPTTKPLTEEEESARGAMLARVLQLKRDRNYPDRWQTIWGNKTALGIYRVAARIVEEGK